MECKALADVASMISAGAAIGSVAGGVVGGVAGHFGLGASLVSGIFGSRNTVSMHNRLGFSAILGGILGLGIGCVICGLWKCYQIKAGAKVKKQDRKIAWSEVCPAGLSKQAETHNDVDGLADLLDLHIARLQEDVGKIRNDVQNGK